MDIWSHTVMENWRWQSSNSTKIDSIHRNPALLVKLIFFAVLGVRPLAVVSTATLCPLKILQNLKCLWYKFKLIIGIRFTISWIKPWPRSMETPSFRYTKTKFILGNCRASKTASETLQKETIRFQLDGRWWIRIGENYIFKHLVQRTINWENRTTKSVCFKNCGNQPYHFWTHRRRSNVVFDCYWHPWIRRPTKPWNKVTLYSN